MEFRLIIQLHLKSVLCLTTSLDGKTLYASFVKIKNRRSLFSSRLINFHAVLQTTAQKTEAPEKNMDQDHAKDSLIMLPVHKIYHSITRKLLSQSITLPKHTSLIKMLLSVQSRSAICWMIAVKNHKPLEQLCLSKHRIKYQCSQKLKMDSNYQFASNVKISTKKSELRLISFIHLLLLQPLLLNLQVQSDKI